ncbi:hypothetical protein ABH923_000331 [Leifsonia sp. EB41]|uniref:hypothetical protein n=1 Tax=Leifsonia sp. EB41 TaxID=3156260 RepID=UPI003512D603
MGGDSTPSVFWRGVQDQERALIALRAKLREQVAWLKRNREVRAPEYLRLAKLIAEGDYTADQLPYLEALMAESYGPAFALRGALAIRHRGVNANGLDRSIAAGYWLTGAAEYDDGASRVLLDEFEMENLGKLIDFDLSFVVDAFLRSETTSKDEDPDARYFMIGLASNLGHEKYAWELHRRK